MPRVAVQIDPASLAQVEATLAAYPRGAGKALSRAVNKVATAARTKIVREIRSEIAIKTRDANKAVTVRKADYKQPAATIKIRGKRLPLIYFGASQKKSGVSYRISKSAGRQTIKSAFIRTMTNSGHRGVFIRRGPARLPINERLGPSIPAVVGNITALSAAVLDAEIRANLAAEIDTQVQLIIDQGSR